ncbi:hypothetical protein F4V47_09210 [Lactococcus garvieae subsp. garvieae]|uniref:hypothetical protein n=1 Tax=Lactococcus garvieae TaxID=1363 RepID=UPI0005A6788A|nr:hypothetical protein [Lactococcus garvieae]KAA8710634.1 hypothetical protein F4V47_09210 [Lactococcus garvieae subsp. garvieae]MDG6191295.1 hypothetical protein [Lactococcus garvieae]PCS02942.1 hypothetical protein RU85_GL001440 [Lactococcus garvieae]QPR49446.1 hypothetical protein I6G86_03045 [Lactococcus garvieae]
MTDIIKFNEEHTPKTEIGKMKFELAEALNTITDLQNGYKFPKLTATERHEKFNKAMITVCNILGIDLDMHEMMKTGAEGFSYSDTEDDTKALEQLLSNSRSHDIKTKLFTLFTLASGLSHSDTDFIAVDDKGVETPATQQALAKALRTSLVELTESLGLSLDQVTESHTEQAQGTVKTIITDLQDMTFKAHELSAGDPEVFGSLVSEELDRILELLGMTELSITAEVKESLPANTIKKELQDIYSLNDSMFTGDPNYIPRYTDGSEIKAKDLADMNMHALEAISELLGFELEEGATPVKTKDQETYDNLPAEDKLNVDMLNKLHEVQDHVLKSGQDAVSMNKVQTAISILEGSLGVMGKVEE